MIMAISVNKDQGETRVILIVLYKGKGELATGLD